MYSSLYFAMCVREFWVQFFRSDNARPPALQERRGCLATAVPRGQEIYSAQSQDEFRGRLTGRSFTKAETSPRPVTTPLMFKVNPAARNCSFTPHCGSTCPDDKPIHSWRVAPFAITPESVPKCEVHSRACDVYEIFSALVAGAVAGAGDRHLFPVSGT